MLGGSVGLATMALESCAVMYAVLLVSLADLAAEPGKELGCGDVGVGDVFSVLAFDF